MYFHESTIFPTALHLSGTQYFFVLRSSPPQSSLRAQNRVKLLSSQLHPKISTRRKNAAAFYSEWKTLNAEEADQRLAVPFCREKVMRSRSLVAKYSCGAVTAVAGNLIRGILISWCFKGVWCWNQDEAPGLSKELGNIALWNFSRGFLVEVVEWFYIIFVNASFTKCNFCFSPLSTKMHICIWKCFENTWVSKVF